VSAFGGLGRTASGPPAPQLPWVGTDPRGYTVILSQQIWNYAAKHHDEFQNAPLGLPPSPFGPVVRALERPDVIIDNSQCRGAPPRVANERYIRRDGYTHPPLVVVVVRILAAPENIEGIAAPIGARVAKTFYVASAVPGGAELWGKKP